ncbi:MAG: Trk system potassium transporter TrkA [Clostridia bacterium]|nr:Trk system potassium transporter TrkA [Clostridia bacterium]
MNVIITGIGHVGRAITEQLVLEGHSIVVIDRHEEKVEDTVNTFDVKGITGNCADREILKEAGVEDADLLIATTTNDELNLLTCIIAKKMGVAKTIARASKPEYLTLYEKDDLGVDLLINPQHEAAMDIARMLRFPSAIKVSQFSESKVELVEFLVQSGSPLVGKALRNLSELYKTKILICAAERNERAIIPSGNFIIKEGDHLFLTATTKNIYAFFKQLGWNKPCRDALIVGGSTTAYYLCQELEKSGIDIKLIEKDKETCEFFSEQLNRVEVVYGDGTDQTLLEEEGINGADAFVTLCNLDEQNIIMSMFASSVNVPKIITKIDQPAYFDMLQKSGIYSAVSTRTAAVDEIIKFSRLMENKKGSGMKRLFRIIDDTAEILEFEAENNFKKFDVEIQNLNLKNNLLIAGIIRDEELITPSGKDVIKEGDHVIIVTLEEGLSNLNDILDY